MNLTTVKKRLDRLEQRIVPPFTGDLFADIRRDVELLEAPRSIDDLPEVLRRDVEIIGTPPPYA